MRRRLSIAPADAEWLPEQLPQRWPCNLPEGEWRGVGPLQAPQGGGPHAAAMGRFFRSRSARPTGGTPPGSGRRAAGDAVEATSPAGGGMSFPSCVRACAAHNATPPKVSDAATDAFFAATWKKTVWLGLAGRAGQRRCGLRALGSQACRGPSGLPGEKQ